MADSSVAGSPFLNGIVFNVQPTAAVAARNASSWLAHGVASHSRSTRVRPPGGRAFRGVVMVIADGGFSAAATNDRAATSWDEVVSPCRPPPAGPADAQPAHTITADTRIARRCARRRRRGSDSIACSFACKSSLRYLRGLAGAETIAARNRNAFQAGTGQPAVYEDVLAGDPRGVGPGQEGDETG